MQTASPWEADTRANMVKNMVCFQSHPLLPFPSSFFSILVLVDHSIIASLTYQWSYFDFDGPSWYVSGGRGDYLPFVTTCGMVSGGEDPIQ